MNKSHTINEVHYVNMSISKIEEQQALSFIKNKIVERVVNLLNDVDDSGYFISKFQKKSEEELITTKEVIRNLKKTAHYKKETHDEAEYADWIEYTSIIRNKEVKPFGDSEKYPSFIKIKFYITKMAKEYEDTYRDVLMAGYQDPFHPSDSQFRCMWYVDYTDKSLTEVDITWGSHAPLTKREIDESLDYLKRVLMPKFIGPINAHYDKIYYNWDKITVQEIIKTLVKEYVEPRRIYYVAKPKPKMAINVHFLIEKGENGKLYIGYFNEDDQRYIMLDLDKGSKNSLNESDSYRWNELKITKREEDEVFEFIKKYLVPVFVNTFNTAKVHSKFALPKELTVDQVLKNLRKQYHHHDDIRYMFKLRNEKTSWDLLFYVNKDWKQSAYQNKHPSIRAGYFDVEIGGVVWIWLDDFRDPKKKDYFKKIKLIKEEDEEKERQKIAREKHAKEVSINKIEEQRALDFIKRVVALKLVECWNREVKEKPSSLTQYRIIKKVNISDVLRNLKKKRHFKFGDSKSPTLCSDYIEYESKVPAIQDWDGKLNDAIFTFYIDKGYSLYYDGYVTHVGYMHPFILQGHSFVVGANYL